MDWFIIGDRADRATGLTVDDVVGDHGRHQPVHAVDGPVAC